MKKTRSVPVLDYLWIQSTTSSHDDSRPWRLVELTGKRFSEECVFVSGLISIQMTGFDFFLSNRNGQSKVSQHSAAVVTGSHRFKLLKTMLRFEDPTKRAVFYFSRVLVWKHMVTWHKSYWRCSIFSPRIWKEKKRQQDEIKRLCGGL